MTEQPAQQIALFATGPTARPSDPDTSQEAGRRQGVSSVLHVIMLEVFAWRGGFGWTQDEMARELRRTESYAESTIKRRFADLENAGLILRTNQRRDTRAKRPAAVYMLATFCNCDGNALREKCPVHREPS